MVARTAEPPVARASFRTIQDIATGVTAPPAGINRATPAPTKAALNAEVGTKVAPGFDDSMAELHAEHVQGA